MRTTISLEERLGRAARRRAREEGLSLSAYVARLLREALSRRPAAVEPAPFRLIVVSGEGPLPGIDLDRPSELLAAEDRERYGER